VEECSLLVSEDTGDTINPLSFSHARDIVELVILTTDEMFLQTLREAVGNTRRLWHVGSPDKVSDLLVAGEVGILVLDAQSLQSAAGGFLSQIKRQFPDLVLIVAGSRDDEAALASLISTGLIYRFIHKPMSPGRARLFADAAVRKYVEQRARVPASARPIRPAAGNRRFVNGAAIGALFLIIAVAAAWGLRHHLSQQTAARPVAVESTRHPPDAAAQADLAEARERLLAQAETALLEERLDDAATAIEAARKGGVESARIAFLSGQLAKSRERQKQAAAQSHANAESHSTASSSDDRLTRALSLAAERMQNGRLIDPDRDSARFYVQEALRIDPNTNAVQAAKQSLAMALLTEAHGAINRRDFVHAAALLDGADGIAGPSNVDSLRRLLSSAHKQADAEASELLLKSGLERLQQDQLIEPANDSAKYYLTTLRGVNPVYPGLAAAMQDLGRRLMGQAQRALALQQVDVARAWADEAAAVGFSSAESAGVLRDLQAASDQQQLMAHVIAANELTLVKRINPAYPRKAEQEKIEGWVELDFTVTESGEVKDIAVHAANPPGVFNQAAIGAMAQWRYQPVLHDATPRPQRARIRIRFALAD
jgi:TonB family protein